MKSSANKDFSHQDLRGKSFKGQDLTGADFSNADIRGVNFKGAILKGANFAHAEGGVSKKSFAVYLLMLLVISVLIGYCMAICNILIAKIAELILNVFKAKTDANIIIYTLLFSIIYISISGAFIRKGKYSLWNIGIIIIVAVAVGGAGAGAVTVVICLAIIVAGTIAITIGGAITGTIAVAIVGYGAVTAVIGGVILGEITETVAVAGAAAAITQLILSVYIAYRISKEDGQFNAIRKFGLSLSSLFGTNFDGADLTDANFCKSNLKYCRFSKKNILLKTCFQNTENLKFAYFFGTILENKTVRELLVSGIGKNQSYAGMNLKGAYLIGADLQGADFHEADLIGAILENANLRDTNLSRIQALGVEFRGADFTGACLESWNIDATTQLDGANADYVYLLCNKLERRPASGNFGEGEFAKLFNEVLDTVDFIFRNGIDWQAFMVSFDNLREKIRVESEDAEISIQGIANKGNGVFVVKVNVPLHTDKPEFHSKLTKEYESNLRLVEAKYQAQLEFKEKEIAIYREQSTKFENILSILASRPIEVKAEAKIDESRKTDIHGNVNNSNVIAGDENKVN